MKTIPLHNPTSQHLFISPDDTEVVPNNLHPLWNGLSGDERSRLSNMADELVCLREMDWVNPAQDHGPWRSAFEETVNEAAWAALPVLSPEVVTASIEQVLGHASVPVDALECLPQHERVSLNCRLTGTVIMAFRYGNPVEESVHSELFGWLEEYTNSLGESLAELIQLASRQKREHMPCLWIDEG